MENKNLRDVVVMSASVPTANELYQGKFHGFFQSQGEEDAFPVALVEDETGKVKEVFADHIRFIS